MRLSGSGDLTPKQDIYTTCLRLRNHCRTGAESVSEAEARAKGCEMLSSQLSRTSATTNSTTLVTYIGPTQDWPYQQSVMNGGGQQALPTFTTELSVGSRTGESLSLFVSSLLSPLVSTGYAKAVDT